MVWLVVVGLSREKGKEGNHLNLCCYDYLPTFIFFLQKDLSTLSYSERAEEPIQDMVLVGTSGWLYHQNIIENSQFAPQAIKTNILKVDNGGRPNNTWNALQVCS
jgi:hypothetical protein